jgi:hypothetical protein
MPDRWNRAPDQIEPITGYRAWHFDVDQGRADLYSFVQSGADWEGASHGWVTASCALPDHHAWHRAPVEECSCGFYAMSTMGPLVEGFATQALLSARGAGSGIVLGRVELAGKVIEHEHGYRAERARIAEFIPFHGSERPVMILGNRLGVPIANAIDLPTIEEIVLRHTQTAPSHHVAADAPLHTGAADASEQEGEWNVILFEAICLVGLLVLIVGNNASPSFAESDVIVVSKLTIILAVIGSRSAQAGHVLERTAKRFATAVSMLACRTRSIWPRRATRS